jgi:tetratricopeptide (TPR) repeat protein
MNVQNLLDTLMGNWLFLVFAGLAIFLFLVVLVLAYFLIKQNKILASLENQMRGFTPESTNVITNQRLSQVFEEAPQSVPPQGGMVAPAPADAGGYSPLAGMMDPGSGPVAAAPPPSAPAPAPVPAAAPAAPVNTGLVTQYQEGTGEGIEEIEAKLSEDPNNPDLLDWLAFMYYSNNQMDRAIEIYQRALNLNYENETQHYYLGNSFYKMGNLDRATEEWEVVVSLKPDSKIASNAQERINKARQQAGG